MFSAKFSWYVQMRGFRGWIVLSLVDATWLSPRHWSAPYFASSRSVPKEAGALVGARLHVSAAIPHCVAFYLGGCLADPRGLLQVINFGPGPPFR